MLRTTQAVYFIRQTSLAQLGLVTFPSNSCFLRGLIHNGHHQETFLLQMNHQGRPHMTFEGYDTLLNECVSQKAIKEGQIVHAHMIKTDFLCSIYLRTRLIVLYTKCESLDDAHNVFDEMPERNVVSWTAMISAYSQRGYASQALNLFVHMLRSGMLGSIMLVLCLFR